ncbi:MAG: hypothetical protein ACRC42_01555, partial [Mycoplasma sp.]
MWKTLSLNFFVEHKVDIGEAIEENIEQIGNNANVQANEIDRMQNIINRSWASWPINSNQNDNNDDTSSVGGSKLTWEREIKKMKLPLIIGTNEFMKDPCVGVAAMANGIANDFEEGGLLQTNLQNQNETEYIPIKVSGIIKGTEEEEKKNPIANSTQVNNTFATVPTITAIPSAEPQKTSIPMIPLIPSVPITSPVQEPVIVSGKGAPAVPTIPGVPSDFLKIPVFDPTKLPPKIEKAPKKTIAVAPKEDFNSLLKRIVESRGKPKEPDQNNEVNTQNNTNNNPIS